MAQTFSFSRSLILDGNVKDRVIMSRLGIYFNKKEQESKRHQEFNNWKVKIIEERFDSYKK